jgi:hypothetical protein
MLPPLNVTPEVVALACEILVAAVVDAVGAARSAPAPVTRIA